jgi:outer membrane protein assembly factor BamD
MQHALQAGPSNLGTASPLELMTNPVRKLFAMSRISRPVFAVVCTAALLAGCSTTKDDPTVNWTPERIYTEARDEVQAGGFDKAVPLFEKLEGRAAGTPLAQQAQIEKAYAQYKAGEKQQAHATLDRFIRLHPASPAIDYALYLKGLVNFNDNLGMFAWLSRQDLSERDQKAAKDSYESFSELVSRFPQSRYAPDARQRMTYIVNSLAQYEVHVARYYYQRSAYVAAIARAQTALSDYQGVPAAQEALDILINAYDKLGMTELRDDAKRVRDSNYAGAPETSLNSKKKEPWWKIW